jgi:uncharacterized protein with HEPN domain
MSRRTPELLVADMLESIIKIEEYVSDMTERQFLDDGRTSDAVVRNLEIIGEAASRLPDVYRSSASQVPWQQVVGLRNRIVHEYFGIDLQLVWVIVHQDLPRLGKTLRGLLG